MPIDLSGLDRLRRKVESLGAVHWRPVAEEMAQILIDDNERRALAGLDKNDRPMPPTQRERSEGRSRREGPGPPLAPKGRQSRLVAFAEGVIYEKSDGEWAATVQWPNFTAAGGRSILKMHARPRNAPYPKRDVLGASPTAVRQCGLAIHRFLSAELKKRLGR